MQNLSIDYTVILVEKDCMEWTYFLANQADSVEHAIEQAENVYPECTTLWVNMGEDYEMN